MSAHLFFSPAAAAASALIPDLDTALERVSADDKAWFTANPTRRYRVRPVEPGEIVPGETYFPGARTVVARVKEDLRLRVVFARVAPHLRENTDKNAEHILRIAPPTIELQSGRVVETLEWLRETTSDRGGPHD